MSTLAFYQPQYIWALTFLALILLIHLLRRNHTIKLAFSTLRFFTTETQNVNRNRKIRNFLLLITRMLVAALIIVLFAKPYDKNNSLAFLKDPQSEIFVWIDPTLSMEYVVDGLTIRERANRLLDSLQMRSSPYAKILHWDYDEHAFEEASDSLKLQNSRYGNSGVQEVVQAFFVEKTKHKNARLLLVTDLQLPTFESIESALSDTHYNNEIIIVSSTPPTTWNYSVMPVSAYVAETGPVVDISVIAAGKALQKGIISVRAGDLQVYTSEISIKLNDTLRLQIPLPQQLSNRSGRVVLECTDPISADNEAPFSFNQAQTPRVLVVGDLGRNYPIQAAFKSLGPQKWATITSKSSANVTFGNIDSSELIIVNALDGPSRPLEQLLTSKSFGQRAIVYALDDNTSEWAVMALRRAGLAQNCTLRTTETPCKPFLSDTLISIWRGFPSLAAQEATVYGWWEKIQGNVLSKLDNKNTFISHLLDSAGNSIILCASPIGITELNNICETGFYVPFLDRLGRHALTFLHQGSDPWYAGMPHANPEKQGSSITNVFNDNGSLVSSWSSQHSVIISKPGVYSVQSSLKSSYDIAVSIDPQELALNYAQPISKIMGKNGYSLMRDKDFLQALYNDDGAVRAYILWITIAILVLVESILWNAGSRLKHV